MFSFAFTKRSLLTGRIAGTHQRLDQAARIAMNPLLKKGQYFPSTKEIIKFEGRKGPDGLKAKSPGIDEPSHFIDPSHPRKSELLMLIKDHYLGLKEALAQKDRVRSAFEAAWMAHFIVDGLTPAHHFPIEDTVNAMMGEKEFFKIFKKPFKGLMRGDTARNFIKNNWRYWGVNGLMSRHIAFEYGAAMVCATTPMRRYTPEITKEDLENFNLEKEFLAFLKEVNKLDLYGRFAKEGWTPRMTSDVEKLLFPAIVRVVALAWASALPKKGKK